MSGYPILNPHLRPAQMKIIFFPTPLLISIKQYESKEGKLRNFRKYLLPYEPFVNLVPNKILQHLLFLGTLTKKLTK